MLQTISEFCTSVSQDMNGLIDRLMSITGRGSADERKAWQKSLPCLSRVLAAAQSRNQNISNAHIYLADLSLEYKLPFASAWCDCILLGKNANNRPQVLIIELKDWDTFSDSPGPTESIIIHNGTSHLHPSEQVKGYTMYCRRFHSTVLDYNAHVDGCVYFTRNAPLASYRLSPNHDLVKAFPVFGIGEEETSSDFPQHVASLLSGQDHEFAETFEKGIYKQDRNILIQVARALRNSQEKPFELLDSQRKGYYLALQAVASAQRNPDKKQVIIVQGPPGSGKSALAANLWIECALRYSKQGNIVFVTTSSSQRSNWEKIFKDNSHSYSKYSFIKPANLYNPGLYGSGVKRLRERGYAMDPQKWQSNIEAYVKEGGKIGVPDNNHFLSIVDEAHALINPEGHRIGFASGWCLQAGPQAYHIIRASKISVFLLDSYQSYRDSETTSMENLRDFAHQNNAELHEISLEGQQFRCGGSKEYGYWVEHLLNAGESSLDLSWRRTQTNPEAPFIFEIVDTPSALDHMLLPLYKKGNTVRLVSSYSVPWKTKRQTDIHNLPAQQQDFHLEYSQNGERREWFRPWNYAPNEDYTMYIQAPLGSAMHDNPLAEVGCPYVVRGFDYDYLGLLWLEDLVWRNNRWKVQLDHVHESGIVSKRSAAKIKAPKRATLEEKEKYYTLQQEGLAQLEDRIKRAYRILLTRSFKGIYLYIQDQETKKHVKSLLNNA